jgi:hypothetical protein
MVSIHKKEISCCDIVIKLKYLTQISSKKTRSSNIIFFILYDFCLISQILVLVYK